MQQWLCQDTVAELRGWPPRVLPTRPVPSGVEFDWLDGLCGGGGSTDGIGRVPGCHVRMAINHWPLAVETHNLNFPNTDHDVANIARPAPGRYPRTDMAWFSPECTYWSIARGEQPDYDSQWEQPALDNPLADDETPAAAEARWRSRMLMSDVIRFTRHHLYRAVLVENVPDIVRWWRFEAWRQELHKIGPGYDTKVIHLNSAFASALGEPAPQLRNRVYIAAWQRRYGTPNWRKWLSPLSWCPTCRQVVHAVYSAKPGPRRPMLYGAGKQYVYRCPNSECRHTVVAPYVLPALSALDLTLPTQRIGERRRPLTPTTRARVAAGIRRHWRHVTGETPEPSQPTGQLAQPPLLVPAGGSRRGRGEQGATSSARPMATRTTTETDAVLQPGRQHDALVVPLRQHAVASPASGQPLVTLAAGGTNHALVMRNNTARGDQGQMSTPATEPLRTLLAEGARQSLITPPGRQLIYSYDTATMRPLTEPLVTQTTVEGDALVDAVSVDVDDCTLRMLAVAEIQAGMAFPPDYRFLACAKRDQVRMLGNAVTPPAARDLAACLVEAVSGTDIELAGWVA
jgi:DNA (cytosine-5)-methyltransferase 1